MVEEIELEFRTQRHFAVRLQIFEISTLQDF